MRAYFAGKVSVAVDRKTPEKSKISAGGATVVLSDLVANARSMRADLDPSWKGDIK